MSANNDCGELAKFIWRTSMSTKLGLVIGVLAGCLLLGCGDESAPNDDAEAQEQIDESNMEEQLENLEREIDAVELD